MSRTHDQPSDIQSGYRFGPQLRDADPHFVTYDASNFKRGLLKRCAHKEHPHVKPIRKEFIAFCRQYIKKLPVLKEGLDREFLLNDWLENSNYNGARKELLRKLNHAYYDNDDNVLVGPHAVYRMYELNSFIKKEFYLEPKEARIINSRSDLFKSIVGPYIHALESIVYDEHFIKHLTPKQVVARMKEVAEGFDLFYETDYSSFEGSFDKELLCKVERRLLSRLLYNYPEIRQVVMHCFDHPNVLRYKRRICAKFEGSRMSGEMWTSMCNGFMNKMLVMFMAHKANANVQFLVEGDDGFIATNKELDVSLVEKIGFKLKFDVTSDHRKISFCSLRVCDNHLVPDIKRTLSHYGSTCDDKVSNIFEAHSKKALRRQNEYRKAKALSLLTVSQGIPILQSVAVQQLRLCGTSRLNYDYVDWWEKSFFDMSKLTVAPVSIKMRRYVEKVFHIPIATQLKIERELETSDSLCYDIDLEL